MKCKIAAGLLSSSCALMNYNRDCNRFSSTLLTTASICIDYRLHEGNYRECHNRSAKKLSNLCLNNGGLFIKAAQHLSSMDHLLPEPFIRELSRLQDSAGASPLKFVEKVFEEEFGMRIDEVFSEICEEPIGSASIGQVHLAKLKGTNEEVAIKIQHENIKKDSEIDLKAFSIALKLIKIIFPSFNFDWLIDELKDCLSSELNFKKEAENSKKTKIFFENNPKFCKILQIPKVYDKFTSERVLTMEFFHGSKITEISKLKSKGIDPIQINREIYKIFMEMIFINQFVHCDPHPGNILINLDRQNNLKIILLDHGIYKKIPSGVIKTFSKLLLAILNQNELEINEISRELQISSELLNQITELLSTLSQFRFHKDLGVMKDFLDNNNDQNSSVSNVIKSVPRELLFLIKILDLLRSNERILTRSSDNNRVPDSLFIITGYCMAALDPKYNKHPSIPNDLMIYFKLFNAYNKIFKNRRQ